MFTVDQFVDDLEPIFDAVHQRSERDFILSLFHIVNSPELERVLRESGNAPITSQFRFNLTPKSLHSVTNLSAYTNYLDAQGQSPEFLVMYSKLYAYLQVLETKYIYKVLGNFLRVLLNQPPDGTLYDELHSGHQCFSRLVALHDELVAGGIQFALFEKWTTFMDRSLRNCIAHNDLNMHAASRTILLPSLLLRQITHPAEAPDIRGVYTFDDVIDYYVSATNFTEAFKCVVSRTIDLGDRY